MSSIKETIEAVPEYFGTNGFIRYAGVHLIIELWQARFMDDQAKIEAIMLGAIEACNATLLNMHLHTFSPNGGVSGAAILSESHISIHTWPEFEYAAMDIFLCGTKDPYRCLPVLKEGFQPGRIQVTEHKRGILND